MMRLLIRKENFEQAKDGIFNDTTTTTDDSNIKRKNSYRSHSLSRLRRGIRQTTNPRRRRGRSYDPFNSASTSTSTSTSDTNNDTNNNSTDGDAAVQLQEQQQYQIEQKLDQQQRKAKITLEEQKGLPSRMTEHHMWYEYYLKPYSMVVQKDYLFFNKDNTESQQDNNEAAGVAVVASHMMLPTTTTTTGSGCCGLAVNAICALCIDAYKEGDIVVWSSYTDNGLQQQQHQSSLSHSKRGSGCSHVFHKNCLIKWLVTKGKTHCPTCQQWYVHRNRLSRQHAHNVFTSIPE